MFPFRALAPVWCDFEGSNSPTYYCSVARVLRGVGAVNGLVVQW
jgi:hypothetical protein